MAAADGGSGAAAAAGGGVQVVFAWGAGEDGQLGLEEAPSNLDEWHVATPTARARTPLAPRRSPCCLHPCARAAAALRDCARPRRLGPRFVCVDGVAARATQQGALRHGARFRRALTAAAAPPTSACRAALQAVPAFVSLPLRVDATSAAPPLVGGSRQSLAVTAAGELYTWGWNQKSSLGLGHQDAAKTPHHVAALAGVRVRQARAAWSSSSLGLSGVRAVIPRHLHVCLTYLACLPARRRRGAAGTAWR
jgi:hypothetical protein